MTGSPSLWSASCASCGAPAAISLAHPDEVRCSACGAVRAPSDDLAAKLRAGQEALDGLDASARQLDGSRRRALSGANQGLWVFVVGIALLVSLSPVYLCGGCMGLVKGNAEDLAFGCACMNMLASLLVATPMMFARMRSAQRGIVEACAAEAPLAAGAPHRCHLCGGDLVAGTEAVARCGYCDADNVVDPSLLEARAEEVREQRDDLASGIRDAGERLNASSGATNFVVVVAAMWTFHAVMALPTIGIAFLLVDLLH